MSEWAALKDSGTDTEWLSALEAIGADRGFYQRLGARHGALFIDESLDVLLVSFSSVAEARMTGPTVAMAEAARQGWSSLSLVSDGATWFRDPEVYGFFDRLVDDAFFEDFDRVIFYGAGPGGYAAAAYSVAAPEAVALLAAPQATLDPAVAIWDDRFSGMRRTSFTDRYGYAPDMLEAAERAFVIYDPAEELDAMHAALFRGPGIRRVRFRQSGAAPGAMLQEMGVLSGLFIRAAAGRLTEADVHKALRARRDHLPYLKNVLNRAHIEDRDWLVALLSRAVLEHHDAPRFRHHLERAEHRLEQSGRRLPRARRRGRAADVLPDLQ